MKKDKKWKIPYVYLRRQFKETEKYFKKIKEVVGKGDFTLGKKVSEFEKKFAKKIGVKYAIGVASGTDALYLVLKALNIGRGDEVITQPNSFIATAAIIALANAIPVFVDVREDFTIDPKLIEKAVNKRTKAIIPVHLTGNPADMHPIMSIARKYDLAVLEDVAQAAFAKYDGKYAGSFGIAGAFSFHPMKILNIWGDGGIITTNDSKLAEKLKLWRNHGLKTREECVFFAHNSRLDTVQAAVAEIVMSTIPPHVKKRIHHAALYDKYLAKLSPWIKIPPRNLSKVKTEPTYTTYVIMVKERKKLTEHLNKKGVEVVIHYPIPIHLQEAAKYLGYKRGDFPMAENQAETILTLPNHQYLTDKDILYVCGAIEEFYTKK